jgi:hypothetical protein
VNTDSRHVCQLAILADLAWLPFNAAKVCFQGQRDFNYLELRHLWEDARVDSEGVRLAGMHYRAVILDEMDQLPEKATAALKQLSASGRLIVWGNSALPKSIRGVRSAKTSEELIRAIDRLIQPDVTLAPASENIRYRHVIKENLHFYIFFNEEAGTIQTTIRLSVSGQGQWLDPYTGTATDATPDQSVIFAPHEVKVLCVDSEP